MSQHDLVIDNASGASVRNDLNNALAALGSTMKGNGAPSSPLGGMQWVEDDNPSGSVWTWKIYDGADWIEVGTIDTTNNRFIVSGNFSAGSVSAPGLTPAGDSDTGLSSPSGNTLVLSTAGTEALRVDSSQNVVVAVGKLGIGTAAPVAQNEVYGAGQSTLGTFNTSGNLGGTLYARDSGTAQYNGGAIMFGANQGAWAAIKSWLTDGSNNTAGGLSIYTRNSTTEASLWERFRIDSSGNIGFNSGYGSVATAYGCRAWVNFNGTGTVAIRASGNVTSITDNGTGNYTVNFTNAMPDANFSAVMHNKILDQYSRLGLFSVDNRTASTAQLRTFVSSNPIATTLTDLDPSLVELAVFR